MIIEDEVSAAMRAELNITRDQITKIKTDIASLKRCPICETEFLPAGRGGQVRRGQSQIYCGQIRCVKKAQRDRARRRATDITEQDRP